MDSARHRSRPVAGLPIADLRDGVDVAKRWLLELIGSAPLAAATLVPAAELARSGPPLCAALVQAIESDSALEHLSESAPAADAGRLAGAPDAAATAAAVEALRVALLSAVRARLSEPSAEFVAAVSDRVADVSAIVLARSLGSAATASEPEIEAPTPAPEAADVSHLRPVVPEPDEPITVSKPSVGDSWRDAIARRIERGGVEEPFAVLTTEIDDVDRLVVSASGKEVAAAIDSAERALIATLAPADVLVRERVGRYWIVSPTAERTAARELGEQLAASVSESGSIAGAPLTASVGLAMYPADGGSADELAAKADEGLFAARSAGIRIA
jgi:GGDEF domain-containing protein